MKKVFLILVVSVFVVGGWMFLKNKREVVLNTPTPTASPASTFLGPSETVSPSPVVSKNIVTYTDSGYMPNTIIIKKGETLIWKNQSSGGMWTASNPHPIHTEYPQSGGCINSAFDECQADPTGTEWSFTFTRVGTWGYHNHVSARDMGTVVVQ